MPRAIWLPEVLAAAGCRVETDPGWGTCGSASFNPKAVVWHHTATSEGWSRAKLVRLIREGRSDLPGPLAQLVLERDGTYVVVASGRANHAGRGGWRGLSGNTSVLGIEAANDGRGEPWPTSQVAAYRRGTAAILARLGRDERWMCGHKEWTPRKVDPYGLDMDRERREVATYLGRHPEEDDVLRRGQQGPDVQWLQDRLNVVLDGRRDGRLKLDGDYGKLTADAVRDAKRLLKWPEDSGDTATSWFGDRMGARIAWSDDDRKRAEHVAQHHRAS